MEVEIDFRKTVQENANKLFEEAKKAKRKLSTAERTLERSMKKLGDAKEGKIEVKKVTVKKRKPRGKWFEAYRWMHTTEGFLVIAGKDARQNEMIFKKRIDENDIVLHADIPGAPLTILKVDKTDPTPSAIREAAEMAGAYSSAWKAGVGNIDVYWIRPDQVSKTAQSGEFLPKGAFMIRGQKNYLKKMTLKLSIGVMFFIDKKTKEEKIKVIGGNVQSINEHAKYFVTIVPGSMSQLEVAKEIKKRILQKAMPEHVDMIEELDADDFVKFIPAGKSSLVG